MNSALVISECNSLCIYLQALSSYVFIAANIILHANQVVQMRHFNELLPPIVPLLTSHHHSLRGFTQVREFTLHLHDMMNPKKFLLLHELNFVLFFWQLLVHQVLCKLYPSYSSRSSEAQLEKQCFEDLKLYLTNNLDCKRYGIHLL